MSIENILQTPIIDLGEYEGNHLWMKREDLIPFSFGGNKARKAKLFFREIDNGEFDCVVTYGSGSSNHCRVVANECCRRNLPCYIISPEGVSSVTFNSQMMGLFGAEITTVPVNEVHNTIEGKIAALQSARMHPYFIEGGGHGNIGTEAYVQCYEEIRRQEEELGIHFDYIFFASGTGTTQAGLVCGQLMSGDERKIVGISIARKNPRGRDVVLDSIRSYLGNSITEEKIQKTTIFIDEYTSGYGKHDKRVERSIETVIAKYGIPLDTTYTGKAYMGMCDYLKKIKKSCILFIHTGGTPLFFDTLLTIRGGV